MPQPTVSQVHEDILLTDISIAHKVDLSMFIADKVFPFLGVKRQSNKYRIYDKAFWFKDSMQKLAPGAAAEETGYGLSTDTYFCDVWALGHIIDDQERANYDEPGDPDTDSTEVLTQLGMIRRERQWVTDFFTTTIWDTDVVGATDFTVWDDQAGSDPRADIQTGMATILQNTGFEPNFMVVGYQVHQALQRHPLIRDQYKHTSSESITAEMLARFFEIENYWISKAVFDSADEGAASTFAFIAGKNVLLGYRAPTPGQKRPSAGYTFGWTGLTGMNNLGQRVLNIPLPEKHGNKIEIQMAFDMKVTGSDMGYFFSGAVT